MFIPVFTLNTDKRIWGKDAQEFKCVTVYLASHVLCEPRVEPKLTLRPVSSRPERWENVPQGAQALPGVWGNIMSFLGGSRACIGYQFSTLE